MSIHAVQKMPSVRVRVRRLLLESPLENALSLKRRAKMGGIISGCIIVEIIELGRPHSIGAFPF